MKLYYLHNKHRQYEREKDLFIELGFTITSNPNEADLLFIMSQHDVSFLHSLNVDKPVVWRTDSTQSHNEELLLTGLRRHKKDFYTVRMSPVEERIKYYAGQDDVIRVFGEAAPAWCGDNKSVVLFQNHYKQKYNDKTAMFDTATMPYQVYLYGHNSENIRRMGRGFVKDKADVLQKHRVAFSLNTVKAYSFSFIDAIMAGIPIVTFSDKTSVMYEVPNLISHGHNGFVVDSVRQAQVVLEKLMNDYDYAKQISANTEMLRTQFSRDVAKDKWQKFFKRIGAL